MEEYLILDENNNQILLPNEEVVKKVQDVLEQGAKLDNMFILENNAYEYLEITVEGKILKILKNATPVYKLMKLNKALEDDIQALKEENKALKRDELTGLYRPDCAMKMVRDYISYAYRTNTEFSIIMGDIDHFKNVNDMYGHEFGNKVLKVVGSTLLHSVKTEFKDCLQDRRKNPSNHDFETNDIVIRYGGEEIMILMKNITLENTIKRVEQLRKKISELDINSVSITMSFGIYHFDIRTNTLVTENDYMMDQRLIEIADKMMYNSKQNGRNKTSYYDNLTGESILVNDK